MTRLALRFWAAILLCVPALLLAQEKAADIPAAPAGIWKITLPAVRQAGQTPLWLLRLEKDKGDWKASILANDEDWPKANVENLKVSDTTIEFQIVTPDQRIACTVKIPKDPKAEKLFGLAEVRKKGVPLELERSVLTTLDSFEQMLEKLNASKPGFETTQLALGLLSNAEAKKVKAPEIRAWARKAEVSAALYGNSWHRDVILAIAATLASQKGAEPIALEYANRAERMLTGTEAVNVQLAVLDSVMNIFEKLEKKEEAKAIQARIAKLDFTIKPKTYAGRKNKSDRAVLGEIFLSTQDKQSVVTQRVSEALTKTFKGNELILLQYQLNYPRDTPNPLATAESEERLNFYASPTRKTTLPQVLLDGKMASLRGGGKEESIEEYEDLSDKVEKQLEKPAGATLAVKATLKGDKITIDTDASSLAETGDDIRLRLVLVEDEIKYKGANGQTIHWNVVRSMPGGADGTVIKEKTFKKTFTVEVPEVKKTVNAFLDKIATKKEFPDKERPVELKKLKIIAFVQNDRTNEVFQTVQVEIKPE